MNFFNVLHAHKSENGASPFKRLRPALLAFWAKRLTQLLLPPLLILAAMTSLAVPAWATKEGRMAPLKLLLAVAFDASARVAWNLRLAFMAAAAITLSVSATHATVVGANVLLHSAEAAYSDGPYAVGAGTEFDVSGGGQAILVDVNPIASTVTITMNYDQPWSVNSFDLQFSGGTLTEFTSISGAGGTAPNAGLYSATASAKKITFNVPYAQDGNGTIVFSFVSLPPGQATPTISVSASNSNPTFGAPVTLTATLAGGASPTGTVTFKDGAATLGTGTISGTTATFSTSALALGARSITAVYAGDTNNATATSAAATVTVGQATPTVTLSASNSNPT
ncbi:Ig-like domain-containing protein, partial [Shinella sp.]|uniref:Ig-like domain-containing protein n=1 Tax=Shinella sp. TaxID=1870904 RepID=UPI0040370E42